MDISINSLTLGKEKIYFWVILVISLVAWVLMAITIFGVIIACGIAFLIWLGNGLLVAQLKSDCVKVDENQLPQLYSILQEICKKLDIKHVPGLYVLQSGGFLNAFAMRHAGRDFVVLYSDIVEAYDINSDEIRFLLGHELGHIKSRHILKQLVLCPALWLPLLGPAYYRAREASCDRFGAFATNDISGAVMAMMILSGGKHLGKNLDPKAFSEQSKNQRGFFVSWYELISAYPTLSQRVAALIAFKDGSSVKYSRNPFAYLFALFTLGGRDAVGGNVFITVAIIAFLAAIAIPNFLMARMAANEKYAKVTIEQMSSAANGYAKAHNGSYPLSSKELVKAVPNLSLNDYCGKTFKGYSYKCQFSQDSFVFTAIPKEKNVTGSVNFYANKEGVFEQKEQRSLPPKR
ncbi:MAG: M48 family metallopeptidase [Candidatus Omnitrophota bacterium]